MLVALWIWLFNLISVSNYGTVSEFVWLLYVTQKRFIVFAWSNAVYTGLSKTSVTRRRTVTPSALRHFYAHSEFNQWRRHFENSRSEVLSLCLWWSLRAIPSTPDARNMSSMYDYIRRKVGSNRAEHWPISSPPDFHFIRPRSQPWF